MAEQDDDGGSRPPPDPLDRIWFHPTELRSFEAVTARAPARADRWGTIGALAAIGLITLIVGVLGATDAVDTDTARETPQAQDAFGARETARFVAATSPSIVAIRVTRPDGIESATGLGTGDGHILTSAHALEGALSIAVVTSDDEELAALPLGSDPHTDLGLVRVGGSQVARARFGSTEGLGVDEPVMAVAWGERRPWISVGAVESRDEFVVWGDTVVAGLIETGTGASSEHSGGALLDDHGMVVGVLTVPPGGEPSGLALPVDVALDVASQLSANGYVVHGWLGVAGTDETDRAGGGARVDTVIPGSPAELAGLAAGDVIVEVGGDPLHSTSVETMGELMAEVRQGTPGTMVRVTVLRNGGARRVDVELGEKFPVHGDGGSAATPGP